MGFLRQADTYFGLICLSVGVYLANLGSGYSGRAGYFPFWLSVAIAVCGAILVFQALLRPPPKWPDWADIAPILLGAFPFAAVLTVWVVVLTMGAGYVLPGLVCAMALLYIAGERGIVRIAMISTIIVVACYLMFAVIFNVNLPEIAYISDLIRPVRRLIH